MKRTLKSSWRVVQLSRSRHVPNHGSAYREGMVVVWGGQIDIELRLDGGWHFVVTWELCDVSFMADPGVLEVWKFVDLLVLNDLLIKRSNFKLHFFRASNGGLNRGFLFGPSLVMAFVSRNIERDDTLEFLKRFLCSGSLMANKRLFMPGQALDMSAF